VRHFAAQTVKGHPYLSSFIYGEPSLGDYIEDNRELHGKDPVKTAIAGRYIAKQAVLGDLALAAAEGLEGMVGKGFASKAAAGLKGAASAVKGAVMAHPVRAAAIGGAAAGLAAGAAMKKQSAYDDMDKAAAVDYLMEQGVDFDSAVQAVAKAAAE
jgi:hypothetical protein